LRNESDVVIGGDIGAISAGGFDGGHSVFPVTFSFDGVVSMLGRCAFEASSLGFAFVHQLKRFAIAVS
jgi:hypothetical protein